MKFVILKLNKMEKLKIGIQSSNVYSTRMNLLKEAKFSNISFDILFSPEEYITEFVEDGIVDIGIVRESIFLETNASVNIVKRLVPDIFVITTDGLFFPVDNLFNPQNPIEVIIANKFLLKEKQDLLDEFLVVVSNLLLDEFFSELPEVSH